MIDFNPSLDYLFQYPVKEVLPVDGGFGIEFGGHSEGTGAIVGVLGTSEVPDLADKVLITVVRSAAETRMVFGHVDERTKNIIDRTEVAVAPDSYFIIDPRFGGEPYYPGRVQPAPDPVESIREQFAGRFADGPEAPETAQEATDTPETAQDTPEA